MKNKKWGGSLWATKWENVYGNGMIYLKQQKETHKDRGEEKETVKMREMGMVCQGLITRRLQLLI